MTKLRRWSGIADTSNDYDQKRMRKASDFREGHQWDEVIAQKLKDEGKHVSAENHIRPQVSQVVGHVIQNPKDVTILNTRGGSRLIAETKSVLIKHTVDTSGGIHQMIDWAERGFITGNGYVVVLKDEERDPLNGDAKIKLLNEFDCRVDTTCLCYNFNGTTGRGDCAKFFFWDEYVDPGWAAGRWPEHKDVIELLSDGPAPLSLAGKLTQFISGIAKGGSEEGTTRSERPAPPLSELRAKLTHCWWPNWTLGRYFYDNTKPETDVTILIDKEDISKADAATKRHPKKFTIKKVQIKVMNHTKIIGSQMLENVVDEFDLTRANLSLFPVVRFTPFWSQYENAGIVDDMIAPTESYNLFRSQVINLLKSLPNAGWIIKKDINDYSTILRRMSGESIPIIDESKCGGSIEKIEPSQFPAGLDAMAQSSKQAIREVANIRTDHPEADLTDQSGRAILAKQASAEIGVSPVLARFDESQKILGSLLDGIISCSTLYSDDEMREIIDEQDLIDETLLDDARSIVVQTLGIPVPEEPAIPDGSLYTDEGPAAIKEAGEAYIEQKQIYEALLAKIDEKAKPMAIEALLDGLRNHNVGKYHTTVALSPHSITVRISKAAEAQLLNKSLIESGHPPLSDKELIENSDVHNKDAILRDRGLA